MEIEIWKDVSMTNKKMFAGLYEISNMGNVRNKNMKILSQHIRNGYYAVCLYSSKLTLKNTANVHRLVAQLFVENIDMNDIVNHIDGNKLNNQSANLEWTTSKGNVEHAIKTGLHTVFCRAVNKYTLDGIFICSYPSVLDASIQCICNDRQICNVCKGYQQTAGGFKWSYVIPDDIVIEPLDSKIITEFPNYSISRDGKVYSKRSKKFLKPKTLQSGYQTVKLCNNIKQIDSYIHVLVREYFS